MTYNQYQEVNTTYINTLFLIMYIIRKVTFFFNLLKKILFILKNDETNTRFDFYEVPRDKENNDE